jgi:hypothetical protein
VGVAGRGRWLVVATGELQGQFVVHAEHDTGVERLDEVNLADQRLHRGGVERRAEVVEGVGDADDAALRLDEGDGLAGGQAVGDVFGQEEAQDLAVGRAHFLADDNLEVGDVADGEAATDGVVVCDGDAVEAGAVDALNDLLWGEDAVGREVGVVVEVGADEGSCCGRLCGRIRRSAGTPLRLRSLRLRWCW